MGWAVRIAKWFVFCDLPNSKNVLKGAFVE
jgi:hypothetical protein